MQTREEAIQWLQERGLFAKPRDWSFGESICVWSSQEMAPGGITVCHDLVCLHQQGNQWCLSDLSSQVKHTSQCGDLAEAAGQALAHFKAKPARQIHDEVHPAHVPMTIEHYQGLAGPPSASIVDLLAMPDAAEVADFDAPRADQLSRPADCG